MVNSASRSSSSTTTAPHLKERSWLEFEESTAIALCNNLAEELKLLAKKANARHVHDTRVALRRWDAVWSVLERDGWRTDAYNKRVGRHLKRLRKRLGELRDWDVNIETGQSFSVPDQLLERWKQERSQAEKRMRRGLKEMKVGKLPKRLRKFIEKRPFQLRREIAQVKVRLLAENAYEHLEPYLVEQEELTKDAEAVAHDWQTLHQLRLRIKHWRYLLTEFFGLTNLELVRAQQLLGKYNDISRISRLLNESEHTKALAKDALAKIESQSELLMKEFTEFRKSLPYGLRPAVVSRKPV